MENIRYVIGIDYGHGETSAAYCDIDLSNEVSDITFHQRTGYVKAIPSAITETDNGKFFIGEEAIDNSTYEGNKLSIGFKGSSNSHKEGLAAWKNFIKLVYQDILKEGRFSKGNHEVYVACPSGWGKAKINNFKSICEEAGLPIAMVTKESRAAFIHAREICKEKNINIDNGFIVIDFGSSTIDMTFVEGSSSEQINIDDSPVDTGADIGAAKVEGLLLGKYLEEQEALKNALASQPDRKNRLLYEFRKIKEKIYSENECTIKVYPENYFSNYNGGSIREVLEQPTLNEYLKKKGYNEELKKHLDKFANKIQGKHISAVFLTGGASRMAFVKPLVARSLEIDESHIFVDEEPSLTISRGIAKLAKKDKKCEEAYNATKQLFQNLTDTILENFEQKTKKEISSTFVRKIDDVLKGFKNSKIDKSVTELTQNVCEKIDEQSKQIPTRESNSLNDCIAENYKEINEKVNEIQKLYAYLGVHKEIDNPGFEPVAFDCSSIRTKVSEVLEKQIEYSFIEYLWKLVKKLFRKDYNKKSEKLSKSDREKLYNKIKTNSWQLIQDTIDEAIAEHLNKHKRGLKNSIKKNTGAKRAAIDDYIKKAKAEIEI